MSMRKNLELLSEPVSRLTPEEFQETAILLTEEQFQELREEAGLLGVQVKELKWHGLPVIVVKQFIGISAKVYGHQRRVLGKPSFFWHNDEWQFLKGN